MTSTTAGLWTQTVAFGRQALVAGKAMVLATVVLGLLYPAAVWGVGQLMPDRADGHLVQDRAGVTRGSALIGQNFAVTDDGWFHSRPSANEYDGLASGASNLGPSNPDLIAAIGERRAAIARVEQVDPGQVPADAVTASASGLDPYISPAYARLQVDRVAEQNGMSRSVVDALVRDHTEGRQLGFLGQPRVDVLGLNLALGGD